MNYEDAKREKLNNMTPEQLDDYMTKGFEKKVKFKREKVIIETGNRMTVEYRDIKDKNEKEGLY